MARHERLLLLCAVLAGSFTVSAALAFARNPDGLRGASSGTGQVLLVLSGFLCGALVLHDSSRKAVPWIGVLAFGFATGGAWMDALLYWRAIEPQTHPGSNPLYGYDSLVTTTVRAILTPLWGVLLAADMALSQRPLPTRGRWIATACLALFYGFVVSQIPGIIRTMIEYPGSYEWGVGWIILVLLLGFSSTTLFATIRAFRGKGAVPEPSVVPA